MDKYADIINTLNNTPIFGYPYQKIEVINSKSSSGGITRQLDGQSTMGWDFANIMPTQQVRISNYQSLSNSQYIAKPSRITTLNNNTTTSKTIITNNYTKSGFRGKLLRALPIKTIITKTREYIPI